ncbi:hypothetical protein RR48_00149, partial [Papilio machaon]
DLQAAERQVADASRRLQQCERELHEARAVQGKPDRPQQDVPDQQLDLQLRNFQKLKEVAKALDLTISSLNPLRVSESALS